MKIAIVTPTYNEANNIETLITKVVRVCKKISNTNFTLFVVDDNSPDNTALIAEKAGKKSKGKNINIKVLKRDKKDGVGRAYIYAFKYLLNKDFDYLIQIDADLSHNPKYINDLVKLAYEGKDFVATSRYMKGGGINDWGLHRRILSRCGNIYSRLFLGSKITDYTNGLNMFSTELLRKINVDELASGGYGFFIELKFKAMHFANNFTQIPIMLNDRQLGKSKIPKNTILINLILVPRLKFRGIK